MRFVGVSTGRAGSQYIATVFRQCGIDTLHEDCFNGDNLSGGRPVWGGRTATGEWSAQAVPYLHLYPHATVFHQVRHPLPTVASFMRFRLFHDPRQFGLQGRVITDHFDVDTSDPLRTAVRFYLDWNRRCDDVADMRWQVEQVTADLLVDVGQRVGVDVDGDVAELVLDTTSTAINGSQSDPLTWDDLTSVPERDELRRMCSRYGYDDA